jgi:hypothetical protein
MTNYQNKYIKYKKKYLALKGGVSPIQEAIENLKKYNIKIVDIETLKENGNIFIKINLGKEEDLNITDQIKSVCNHYGIGYKLTLL